jgi:pantoate kinase
LRPRVSTAFAPSAITNFFEISYNSSTHASGATGGGYILSRGTTSRATVAPGSRGRVLTRVNGDDSYDARTTRRAVGLLLAEENVRRMAVRVDQTVDTPIGGGFGASAAAATSAVYAVAGAARVERPKEQLALYAHRAEIIEQTGLGTVSVLFESVGAGAITVPGIPGKSRFVRVKVPRGTRIVTAFLAPYDKKDALASRSVTDRINALGHAALEAFKNEPTLDVLASEGERFSRELGLESTEVKKMIRAAKGAGASYASQNMIGYSMHSVVAEGEIKKVARALRGLSSEIRVDVFGVGARRAGARPNRR